MFAVKIRGGEGGEHRFMRWAKGVGKILGVIEQWVHAV
jgi:hypothetical protein